MDASRKQREPVAFKSLAELKRFIRPGVELKTVSHANHVDMVGLTRVVTTVQTVGFYSKIKDQPEHPFSTCNHGKGFYTDFGKAGNYIFDGTTVKVKDTRKQDRGVIYELEFYDREQNMEETMMDRKMVNFIKEQYPPGTRIRLNSMDDPYAPILPGTEGEVDFVDDEGQIFMKWDNGRTLPLIPGEDSFTVLPPKLTTLKLYMPLTADLYERNEYGDLDDSSTLLEGRELRGYQDQITAALVKNRMPELSVYSIPCRDEIQTEKDKPLETWSWDKAEKMEGMEEFPTGSSPWKKGKDAGRMQALLEKCREWKDAKLASLKACPAAKDFPGVPENGAQTVRRTVEIDSNIGGWHSTGLYAPPGAEISCSLSGAPKDGSISVRIGCHTDSLHKLDEWKRVPEITMQVPAGRGRVKMVNPMGGLVYVNVGQRPRRGKVFKVQISGAVPSPLFVMGKTTPEQWAEQLENTKAPWGEIRMPRLIVTMPVEQLKQCPDVQKTAEFLQKNMALQDWIMGWDTKPDRLHHPMRFVVDRQISAGAGHSGYPAMATKDWTNSIATGSIIHSGSWGLWHELGHNHQSPPFTMEGQTEVSVNIFSMVCEVMGTGKDFESCWGGGMGPSGMSAEMKKYFSGTQTYNEAPNKVQLFFWVELMYYLGFDAFRQVALQFHDKPYDNGELSDEKKWEWVMNAFSKVTGKNMGPFFKIWRTPVSERAAGRMKDLPAWLPSRDYPACYTAEE